MKKAGSGIIGIGCSFRQSTVPEKIKALNYNEKGLQENNQRQKGRCHKGIELAFFGRYLLSRINSSAQHKQKCRRIGVCWLMAVMALILAGVAAHMWFPKINLAGWTLSCLCVMVIALNVCNPDRLAAKYNIGQYLASAPACAHLDTSYLSKLAPSAVLELDRLKGTPLRTAQGEIVMLSSGEVSVRGMLGYC